MCDCSCLTVVALPPSNRAFAYSNTSAKYDEHGLLKSMLYKLSQALSLHDCLKWFPRSFLSLSGIFIPLNKSLLSRICSFPLFWQYRKIHYFGLNISTFTSRNVFDMYCRKIGTENRIHMLLGFPSTCQCCDLYFYQIPVWRSQRWWIVEKYQQPMSK